jgi:hypothetical protein
MVQMPVSKGERRPLQSRRDHLISFWRDIVTNQLMRLISAAFSPLFLPDRPVGSFIKFNLKV